MPPITKPTEKPPEVDASDLLNSSRAYRSHGWVFIPDCPAAGPMTSEEFAKVPLEERVSQ